MKKADPFLLFIGAKHSKGKIKAERCAPILLEDTAGIVRQDHWDRKGKATAQLS